MSRGVLKSFISSDTSIADVTRNSPMLHLLRIALGFTGVAFVFTAHANAACTAPTGGGITVCSPANGGNTVNPVHYIAAASSPTCSGGVSSISVWNSSGNQLYSVAGSKLDAFVPMWPGSRSTLVKARDKCGVTRQTSVSLSVRGTAVITYQYNLQRTGANPYESILRPANVNKALFGKLFSCAVDSYIYGQPLFMPRMNIAGGTHNVVYVATERNSVYAFDADGKTCTPLWHKSIGTPVPCSTNLPVSGSNCPSTLGTSTVGITSTMFIDPTQGAHGVIYVEGRIAPGGVSPYYHQLHKLDLVTGQEISDSPVTIKATIGGNSCDNVNGIVAFNSAAQHDRSALLYANGVLYIGFASINDVPKCPNGAYHGWLLGYNAFNVQQQISVFNTSRNQSGNGSGAGGFGGIWGGALAAALDNRIYAATGNGPFNPSVGDWGNSYLKLSPAGKTLAVADFFSPSYLFDNGDLDLGTSSGIIVTVPGPYPHELIGGSKIGTLYVVNRDKMGKFNSSSDAIIQELPKAVGARLSTSTHCSPTRNDCDFSTPAYWNSHLFVTGVDDHVKEFALANGKLNGPTSKSAESFAYPGATAAVSASGTTNGVVWVVEPGKAILHAYDATSLATELYNSNQNSARDALGSFVKFAPVTVVNGKVYVGTKGRLVAYGVLP